MRTSHRYPRTLGLLSSLLVALGAAACARGGTPATATSRTTPEGARALLEVLAHDSLMGRRVGTEHAMKAARIIAARMAALGLEPLGDDGTFLQRVPLEAAAPGARGAPEATERPAANVVGLLRGSDPALRDEYVIVGAHYDHVGASATRGVAGDSIFNGADDDASGVVAVLEAARQLAGAGAQPSRPRRSIIFVAFTGEESGMTGTRRFIAAPPRPLAQVVADIQVEMIGRPDSLAGGPGKGWLTGYERSTMGERLAAAGVPLVADPRPAMNFFARSDNYPFARIGIPAHTISSYGGHGDYHRVSDEVGTIDFAHLSAMVNHVADAVRAVADGARPEWKAGGRPE